MSRREQEHRRQRKAARRNRRAALRTPGLNAIRSLRRHRTLGSAARGTLRGYRPPKVLVEEMQYAQAREQRRVARREARVARGGEIMERMVAHNA